MIILIVYVVLIYKIRPYNRKDHNLFNNLDLLINMALCLNVIQSHMWNSQKLMIIDKIDPSNEQLKNKAERLGQAPVFQYILKGTEKLVLGFNVFVILVMITYFVIILMVAKLNPIFEQKIYFGMIVPLRSWS